MFCPKCGKEQQDDARFCPGCGAENKSKSAEAKGDAGVGISQPVSNAAPDVPSPASGTPKPKKKTGLIAGIIAAVVVVAAVLVFVFVNPFATGTKGAPATGLIINDLTVGIGDVAEPGSTVQVLYTGALADGTVFDSTDNTGQPFTFVLGAGNVTKGWDTGLVGMKVGGTRELVIPPELAFGAYANGNIPANSTLHFKIQLLKVTPPTSQNQ